MQKFTRITGVAASMLQENIDTDQIIPAAWLRSLSSDLGKGLFAGWRYDMEGRENAEFVLNRPPFRDSRIVMAGANFGCGSSRESAVWALYRFGIRCVIAPSFGDIFTENAYKNGLLLVTLPDADVKMLTETLATGNDPTLTVDLEHCVIGTSRGGVIPFSIRPARRDALLQGLDEIATTLEHVDAIDRFQTQDRERQPWIYERSYVG